MSGQQLSASATFPPGSAVQSAGDGRANGVRAAPTIIVADVHVSYRLRHRGPSRGASAAAWRLLHRGRASNRRREIHAVRGVTFTVSQGEAVGVVGANGSGKSTLLRAIAGLIAPASGAIYTRGAPALLGIGGALMPELTGERNIELGCLAMGMTPAEVLDVRDDIIAFADLGEFISLPMTTYSTGMSARLRFAIAAARPREILLIDETLATGDASFRRRSEQRIRELKELAGTIVLVSHNPQAISDTCARTLWLAEGRLRMDGPTAKVLDAYLAAEGGDDGWARPAGACR
jgi:teichoic acid transport system ATP-binding protein